MSEHTEKHIVAIDLGTSKMALIVAKVNGSNVEIVYYKETQSAGINYSSVWNISQAKEPLCRLIRDAEESLNIKINQVVIGMPKYLSVRSQTAERSWTEGKIPRSQLKM